MAACRRRSSVGTSGPASCRAGGVHLAACQVWCQCGTIVVVPGQGELDCRSSCNLRDSV